MKITKLVTLKNSLILTAALSAGVFAGAAGANDRSRAGAEPSVIYQSPAADYGIHSYPSNLPGKVALNPQLIYVSQAYGPAIHSYAHPGSELVVPWNVEYVDMAYGPAIYSYERPLPGGEVKVLPIVVD